MPSSSRTTQVPSIAFDASKFILTFYILLELIQIDCPILVLVELLEHPHDVRQLCAVSEGLEVVFYVIKNDEVFTSLADLAEQVFQLDVLRLIFILNQAIYYISFNRF